MTITDSHYHRNEESDRKIRAYCVNITKEYCRIVGEPLSLSQGVKLVRNAIAKEHRIQVPHEDLTIRRRFNEAQTERFGNELIWIGQKTINGLKDSWYIVNPLLVDEETRAKLEKWLPQKLNQSQLFA